MTKTAITVEVISERDDATHKLRVRQCAGGIIELNWVPIRSASESIKPTHLLLDDAVTLADAIFTVAKHMQKETNEHD